ncbi:unnamed protein product [Caenorhabditis auriculariae]|uniref:Metalloendopeptidase n=1 Tax=Caenorhabditis auriculariae TaxID=2777116 RepID=A0A8S1HSN6_9PELO|nr:unnamed protein product [Caenorhabditis auriculariae]
MRVVWVYILVLVNAFHAVLALRGKPINIFGPENGGGDIMHLRRPRSADGTNKLRSAMRNVIKPESSLRWSKMTDDDGNFLIPYVITGLYDQLELSVIQQAIQRINENTCVRYVPRNNERDFIDIRNQRGEGCYASVGRYNKGANVLMLEANDYATCIRPYTVLHEMLHTLGLWHEHMRTDRDRYIDVLYGNIEAIYYEQFTKLSEGDTTTFGIPYDYTSIMHYDETAFAKKGLISMRTKNPLYQKRIGRVTEASENDYNKICLLYGCHTCMKKPFNSAAFVPKPVEAVTMALPKDCQDSNGMCDVLKTRGILNCGWMSYYCCASCNNIYQVPKVSNPPVTPVPTSAPKSFFENAWDSVKSIFG